MFRYLREQYRDKREDLADLLDDFAMAFVIVYIDHVIREHRARTWPIDSRTTSPQIPGEK